jgi:hypothetical protein
MMRWVAMIFTLVYSSSYVFLRKSYYDNVPKKVDEEKENLLQTPNDLLGNDDDREERY